MATLSTSKNRIGFRAVLQRFEKYLYIGPSFVLLVMAIGYLFFYLINLSLTDTLLIMPDAAKYIGLSNYSSLLQDSLLWISLKNTAIFVIGGVLGQLVLGMIMALVFNRPFRGNNVLIGLVSMPSFSAGMTIGLIWSYFYNGDFGLINQLLALVGVSGQTLISRPQTALWGLMIVYIWQYTPFVFLILLAGLRSLSSEPYEAALIDGASKLQTFTHITFPLLKPTLLVATCFQIAQGFHSFDLIYSLTFGGPGTSTHVMSFSVYKEAFYLYRLGYSAAFAVLMLVVALTVISVFLRKMNNQSENF